MSWSQRRYNKNYFMNYNEYISNDFIISNGGKNITLLNTDIDDWNITFVDTGMNVNIGQRLKAVKNIYRMKMFFWLIIVMD